jgi:hypothetical protein
VVGATYILPQGGTEGTKQFNREKRQIREMVEDFSATDGRRFLPQRGTEGTKQNLLNILCAFCAFSRLISPLCSWRLGGCSVRVD